MRRLICLLLFSISFSVTAQIIYVSPNQKIQDAIDEAKDGDIIIIEEGNYIQQFNFKGKAITVGSRFILDGDTSHISKTIIDGIFLPQKDSSSLVYFHSGEDSNSILSGLTLQNGRGTFFKGTQWYYVVGGAISIENSGAKISNNIIRNNNAINETGTDYNWNSAWGGAIDCYGLPKDKTIIITENVLKKNFIESKHAQAMGGAINLEYTYGKAVISKNRIVDNDVKSIKSGYGGGIAVAGASNFSDIRIENNYIANNSTYAVRGSTKGGGIACYFSAPVIRNNIIVYNSTNYPQGVSDDAFGGGIAVHWYENFKDEWTVCENPYLLSVIIENNTIAYNNDKLAGGGVALRSVDARLRNNIIGCNFAANSKQIKIEFIDAPETIKRRVIIEYSNVEGGFEGEGNINEFPQFADDDKWYLKKDYSPCIDAGNYENKYNDVEDPQVSGQARFPALGKLRNDIGAFGGPHSKWTDDLVTDVKNIELTMPESPSLSQNYPNPFNPSTTIKYSIPIDTRNEIGDVRLIIYDILGRKIKTLVSEKQKPGNYEIEWDGLSASGGQVPSGIYFYKFITENYSLTKKMIFLK